MTSCSYIRTSMQNKRKPKLSNNESSSQMVGRSFSVSILHIGQSKSQRQGKINRLAIFEAVHKLRNVKEGE